MENRNRLKIYILLILLNVGFIWGNSMQPASVSSMFSGGLLRYLKVLVVVFGDWAEFVLRKLAHFSEFACLGFLLTRAVMLAGERGIHRVSGPLLLGLLAACVDETIQMFVEGRDSSLRDVWVDTAGVCTGILLMLLLISLVGRIRHRKENKTR